MTATKTDELRALLDERGIKYETDDTQVLDDGTMYYCTITADWEYDEPPECGILINSRYDLGAEDAIEATVREQSDLHMRTCHMRLRDDIRGHCYQDVYECSECGEQAISETYMGESEPPRYCPNCGRKVVDE